jgi:pimeloyl-ACP methyl ester carboxylesterase
MSAADSNEAKIKRATSIELIKREGLARYAETFLKAVFAPQTFDTNPGIIEEIRKTILSNSPLGMCGALLAMAGRTDSSEALSRIGVPTLILVGEHDAVTPPTAAKSMHDRIQNSELYLISNAGHMSNLENPVMFNEHLIKFLDGID